MRAAKINGLSQDDICLMYKMVIRYQQICDKNAFSTITAKGLNNILQIYQKRTKTINQFIQNPVEGTFYITNKACDANFVRHLRNSFAHGRVNKVKDTITITDTDFHNPQKITMFGQLPYKEFHTVINLIINSL